MKLAVVSDIHGNLEAFRAVLADAEARGVEKFACLGDLTTLECVDLTRELNDKGKLEALVLGNGDSLDATRFGLPEDAVFWTRERLEASLTAQDLARWDFLGAIPRVCAKGKFLFVHGSPRDPLNEYVRESDACDADKMAKLFALTPRYCFQGHTHDPGVFVEEANGGFSYFSAAELDGGVFPLDERKLMVNVGSAGRPGDASGLSCYVIVHYEENGAENKIEYRRLPLAGQTAANA
ncbi:MAG: metallophosphoesterase family protein [Thermoguttaceae bacterium]|nr:metallophosphoesterase family protein [Thermoguttaceae bacterium]MBQ5789061.1 metallophosphoesterase family protein [Thermoguttaceae bacterium]